MPPVPIYSKSPINANKASGVTPQTAAPAEDRGGGLGRPAPTAATTTVNPTKTLCYIQAQPGAVPSIPAPTGAAGGVGASAAPAPTAMATLQSLGGGGGPPPAPQPGAVPVPPGVQASRTAPPVAPPLRAGEKYRLSTPGPEVTPAPQLGQTYYPPQMSVLPPQAPFQQRGTMTASGTSGSASQLPSVSSIQISSHSNSDLDRDSSLEHPPGYRQSIGESPAFGSPHRYHQQHRYNGSGGQEEQEEGVWDAAKKFVQATGEKLAVAEEEVWKRISKG